MSQNSVLRLLEKSKIPLSAKEISDKLGITCANANLRRLVKYKEIKWVWLVKKGKIKIRAKKVPILHYFV